MAIPDILKTKILDFQEKELRKTYSRDINYLLNMPEAKGLFGIRRSGKTCALQNLIQQLLDQGVDKKQILWLELEDERLQSKDVSLLSQALDIYNSLFPETLNQQRYLIFDEIQEVQQWEKFIRRIQDETEDQIFITGSSSSLLGQELHTSMRGRATGIKIYPLSFLEVTGIHNIDIRKMSSAKRAKCQNLFDTYLQWGGFPAVQAADPENKLNLLRGYSKIVLLKDIIERYKVSNSQAIIYMQEFLLRNFACSLAINKVYGVLKSQGIKVGLETVHEYFYYFQQACFIESVPIFSDSLAKQRVNPAKVYLSDHGLALPFSLGINQKNGARLENIVAIHLLKLFPEKVYYYKTKTDYEVDFMVQRINAEPLLIQVAWELENPATLKRELRALTAAMEETGIQEAVIITSDRAPESMELKGGKIQITNFIDWLAVGKP